MKKRERRERKIVKNNIPSNIKYNCSKLKKKTKENNIFAQTFFLNDKKSNYFYFRF